MKYKLNGREVTQEEFSHGCQDKLAEMLALGQPPMSNSDREFLAGRGGCYEQFKGQPGPASYYAHIAKQAGLNTTGKLYLSSLARFPGDPEAWVSGRGDVHRVCASHGWGAEGSVKLPVRNVAPVTGGGVARDIVDREVAEAMAGSPEPLRYEEVEATIIEQRAPHWAPAVVPA